MCYFVSSEEAERIKGVSRSQVELALDEGESHRARVARDRRAQRAECLARSVPRHRRLPRPIATPGRRDKRELLSKRLEEAFRATIRVALCAARLHHELAVDRDELVRRLEDAERLARGVRFFDLDEHPTVGAVARDEDRESEPLELEPAQSIAEDLERRPRASIATLLFRGFVLFCFELFRGSERAYVFASRIRAKVRGFILVSRRQDAASTSVCVNTTFFSFMVRTFSRSSRRTFASYSPCAASRSRLAAMGSRLASVRAIFLAASTQRAERSAMSSASYPSRSGRRTISSEQGRLESQRSSTNEYEPRAASVLREVGPAAKRRVRAECVGRRLSPNKDCAQYDHSKRLVIFLVVFFE